MSEQDHHPPDKSKRLREAQDTRRTSRKRTQQATPASLPKQGAAPPLAAPDSSGSAATQPLPVAEILAQPAPDEPPIGEPWGEFPPVKRQAELKQRMEAWEQDHGTRSGPFANFILTGTDVYFLAVLVTGSGDVQAGKKDLDENLFFGVHNLHLEGTWLFNAHLKGAFLSEADMKGAHLRRAHLEGAHLRGTHLEGTNLSGTDLKGANLSRAHLEDADLSWANLYQLGEFMRGNL